MPVWPHIVVISLTALAPQQLVRRPGLSWAAPAQTPRCSPLRLADPSGTARAERRKKQNRRRRFVISV